MSALHSPGPWAATYDPAGDRFSLDDADGKNIVGGCGCCGSPFMGDNFIADARLIAAAPDLLAALKRCRFDSLNMSLEDLEFCRAAIAKATGGAA